MLFQDHDRSTYCYSGIVILDLSLQTKADKEEWVIFHQWQVILVILKSQHIHYSHVVPLEVLLCCKFI